MVKNKKKFGAQTFGLIALSLMLVASLVLGMTGAWFTDTDNKSVEGTFGTILIDTMTAPSFSATGLENSLLPGDDITLPQVKMAGTSSKAWVRFKVEITGDAVKEGEGKGVLIKNGEATYEGVGYTTPVAVDPGAVVVAEQKLTIDGPGTGNDVALQSINVKVTVEAIQWSHMTAAEAAAAMDTKCPAASSRV